MSPVDVDDDDDDGTTDDDDFDFFRNLEGEKMTACERKDDLMFTLLFSIVAAAAAVASTLSSRCWLADLDRVR